ncbi:MAG: TetR family transcriptional regulator [Robiginitomaculum sp.]|nr:MAG: TetR family transcriptional regulator [Robiginitomaculum sp.]
MARPQANDYKKKREHILQVATQLFAQQSFHATSITDIAKACNTSKSRLYHYFPSKEQVLYEILNEHAQTLVNTFLPIIKEPTLDAKERLEKYARHFLRINVKFRAQHKLILGELDALPQAQRDQIAASLRQPVEAIFDTLVELNPKLEEKLQFPVTMMFIGMLNWTHTWFEEDGNLSIEKFSAMICETFLNGFTNQTFE